VTHLDVSREDIERTIKIVWGVLSQH
jgi:hypothetical protein